MKTVIAFLSAAVMLSVAAGAASAVSVADEPDTAFYAAANGRGAGDCTGPIGGGGKNPAPGRRSVQDDAFAPVGKGRGPGDGTGPNSDCIGKNPAPGRRSVQDDGFEMTGYGRGPGDGTGPNGGTCPNPNPGPRGPGGGKRPGQ